VAKDWEKSPFQFEHFQGRRVWNAAVYDTNTDKPISFTGHTIIPHNGRKQIWQLEFFIDLAFYKKLLTEHKVYLSGISLLLITDLGNLKARYDSDMQQLAETVL
jgi:hypothetical protein